MARANAYLFSGEEVVLLVRPHPIVLAKPGAAPLAGIALFTAFPNQFTFVMLLVVLTRFAWDVGMWFSDRFVLTTDRVLGISGFFTKRVVSMPLAKITDLTFERSVLGRVLGYGRLVLESAGQQQGIESIDFLPEPDHFYRTIMALALGPRPVVLDPDPAEPEVGPIDVEAPGGRPPYPHENFGFDDNDVDLDSPSGQADDPQSAGRHLRSASADDTAQIPAVRSSED